MKEFPKEVVVQVMKDNIAHGVKGRSDTCAFARGLNRVLQLKKKKCIAKVYNGDDIDIVKDGRVIAKYKGKTLTEQRRINDFIDAFDKKKSNVRQTKFRLVRN
jgi:hypothetical protein